MKKTISVNISGIIFNIEEDAYNKLKIYLSTIKGYFERTESQDEIIDDIESRIAELFEEKISPSRQVITEVDVNEIITIMGEPEDYIDDEDLGPVKSNDQRSYNQSSDKKLFRDKEQGIIGGVSVGLGAYFGIETVWVRLFWVLMVLFFGFGIIPYIILWAVIPMAKTTSDKLRMHGDPVDIESIKKKVDEGLAKVSYEADNFGKKHRSKGRGLAGLISEIVDLFVGFLRVILKFIGYFVGIIFLFIGLGLLIGIISLFFDSSNMFGGIGLYPVTVNEAMTGVFDSSIHGGMFMLGAILLIGIPVLSVVLVGLRMIFKFQWPYKGVGAALITSWIIGLFLTIISSINLGSNFIYEDEVSSSFDVNIESDTLRIRLTQPPMIEGKVRINGLRIHDVDVEDDQVTAGNINLDIQGTDVGEKMTLQIIKSSHGQDYEEIEEKISNIEIDYKIENNILSINPRYTFPLEDKFRSQEVRFVLTIPNDKFIFMEDKIHLIIDEFDSDFRRSKRHLMNEYLIMTKDGIKEADKWREEKSKALKKDSIREGSIKERAIKEKENSRKVEIVID